MSEFIAGTDPSDSSDVFRITNHEIQVDSFTIVWPSVEGRTYEVLWSTDLEVWNFHSIHQGTGDELDTILLKNDLDALDGSIGNLTNTFVRVEVFLP